jgi:hypothetical protein
MNLTETVAIISIAGFAVQRTLELIDPLFVGFTLLLQRLNKGKLPLGLTEGGLKTWLMTLTAFLISLPIAFVTHTVILSQVNIEWGGLDVVISALAISAGSNGVNSVLKFSELVKDSRKVEVKPLPEVKVSPSSATIKPGATINILASVAGSDNAAVDWEVLEGTAGGGVTTDPTTPAGRYTAPSAVGEYHVAAISQANQSASAIATIKVAA